jgi:hypothetical protein
MPRYDMYVRIAYLGTEQKPKERLVSANTVATSSKSPLDAAQKIVAELQGMTPEHRSLALKFAAETLGLNLPSLTAQPAHVPPAAAHPPATTPPAHSGGGHSTDIKSFTTLKTPKSDQQFAAVVAYFYQFEAPPDQRKDMIDVETMKHAARLAGRRQPPKWIYTLTNAKNAGYLDSAGDGNFKLSPVGENLVAITLPDNASAPVSGKRRPPQKKVKKSASKKKKNSA